MNFLPQFLKRKIQSRWLSRVSFRYYSSHSLQVALFPTLGRLHTHTQTHTLHMKIWGCCPQISGVLCRSLFYIFRLLWWLLALSSSSALLGAQSWLHTLSRWSQSSAELFCLSPASVSCAACRPVFGSHRFVYLSGFLAVRVGKVNPVPYGSILARSRSP